MQPPKITPVELPRAHERYRHSTPRCEMVKQTCTSLYNGEKNRCSRFATYNVDGTELCTQHAGEIALRMMLDAQ